MLVSQWSTGPRVPPIERCVPIERATEGAVTRQDLRPSDWQDIWPELAEAKTDQAQDAITAVVEEAKATILHVAETAEAKINRATKELVRVEETAAEFMRVSGDLLADSARASQAATEPWDGVTERRHPDVPTPALSQAIDTFARAGLIERRLVVRRSASRGRRAGEVD